MQVAKSSTIPSANDVIDFCCRRDFIYKPRIVATFFFQQRAAFELFYSTFSSGFLFQENKSEKNSTTENKFVAATYVQVCTEQQKFRFLQFFAIFGEIAEIAVFAGHPSTSCTT